MTVSVRENLDVKRMTMFQWAVVAQCFLINMLDGFDVLVMAFAAPAVSQHWTLTGTRLGYLLSAGLLGMAAGSLFVAPLADRIGRRPLMLLCLTVAGCGMLASAYASSAVELGVLRLVTGLGIGGILASSYVLAGEYANKRYRSLAVSLQATAYALGATVGGIAAAKVIPQLGWSSVFFYGGVLTLALIPLLFFFLPESLDYLLEKQPRGSLIKVNRLLRRVQLLPLNVLPAISSSIPKNVVRSVVELLSTDLLKSTLLIWIAFFSVMFGFYFIISWTPRLLVDMGLSASQGITGGVLLNVGGIIGNAIIGLLAVKYKLPRVLLAYMIINIILLTILVPALKISEVSFGLVIGIGLFANGCVAGLYALTPSLYRPAQRVTGLGWGIGIGRIGAIFSPLAAGALLDSGWRPSDLYPIFALSFVISAVAILGLTVSSRVKLGSAYLR